MTTGRQDGAGWVAVGVDAVEAIPWRGTELVRRPVRTALETRMVGMSAYTGERVGQEVVEDHTESGDGRGHDEVYVVLRGRATLHLDGDTVDAPAGTLGSDWIERARPHMRGRPEQARAVLEEELRAEPPDSPGLLLGEALLHASQGDEVAARDSLRAAIHRAPGLRAEAEREPLLAPLLAGLG